MAVNCTEIHRNAVLKEVELMEITSVTGTTYAYYRYTCAILGFGPCVDESRNPPCIPDLDNPICSADAYTGTWAKTKSGIDCQRWDTIMPNYPLHPSYPGYENYCRNPDGVSSKGPFCIKGDATYAPSEQTELCFDVCPAPETTEGTTIEETTETASTDQEVSTPTTPAEDEETTETIAWTDQEVSTPTTPAEDEEMTETTGTESLPTTDTQETGSTVSLDTDGTTETREESEATTESSAGTTEEKQTTTMPTTSVLPTATTTSSSTLSPPTTQPSKLPMACERHFEKPRSSQSMCIVLIVQEDNGGKAAQACEDLGAQMVESRQMPNTKPIGEVVRKMRLPCLPQGYCDHVVKFNAYYCNSS